MKVGIGSDIARPPVGLHAALPWRDAPLASVVPAQALLDRADVSTRVNAAGTGVAAAVTSLAVGAAPAAVPGTPVSVLTDLQARGFQLLYKRRLYVPGLMASRVPLSPQDFADRLREGSSRLEVGSKDFVPVAVQGSDDLAALATFYLGATPSAPVVGAIQALYLNGWQFARRSDNVGPYGAYRAVSDGTSVTARKYQAVDLALQSPQDAYRAQYFRLGTLNPSFEHAAEAATLKALESRKAVLWTGSGVDDRCSAERAYQRLFQGGKMDGLWVGTREAPLVEVRETLADENATVLAFDAAHAEYQQILQAGFPRDWGYRAWETVRPAVSGEPLSHRLQWSRALIAAEWSEPGVAIGSYQMLAAAGPAMDDAVKQYVEIRQALPQYASDEARKCYRRLRDKMDRALPGPEAAAEKRAHYVNLLKALGSGSVVEKVWKSLDGAGTRADRVAVFLDLLSQEHGFLESARADYKAVVRECRAGETVMQAAQEFKRVRAMLGRYGSHDACSAFRYMRRDLDASLPGPWTSAERHEMMTSLLQATGSFDVTKKTWKWLAGDGFFTGPQPPSDFPARLKGFLDVYHAEDRSADEARKSFELVLGKVRPGEAVAHAVGEFVGLRQRLGDRSTEVARKAFEFLRSDFAQRLDGPWPAADKERTYLKMLTVLRDHDQVLDAWGRIHGPGPAPADFTQRIDVFLDVCGMERFQDDQAWKSYGVVVDNLRAGETVGDALKSFADWRGRVGTYDAEDGRAAFVFVRRDLAATLPGAWSDAQREAMYGRVLGVMRKQAEALETWKGLIGKQAPPDFADVVEGFAQLTEIEGGEPTAGKRALDALRDVQGRRAGSRLMDLVSEYRGLRRYVGPYDTSEAISLTRFVVETLDPKHRTAYLQLQEVSKTFGAAQVAWSDLNKEPATLAERHAVLVDCLRKERRDLVVAWDQLEAVCGNRRPSETITQAAAALDRIRQAVPAFAGDVVAAAFRYMRENTDVTQENLFLQMLKGCESFSYTVQMWEGLQKTGGDATFALRVQTLLSRPVEQWQGMLGEIQRLVKAVPPNVDVDRGTRALLRLARVNDTRALSLVLTRLEATPGLDRTTALEWLCAMMSLAGSLEAFEQGWRDVHRPGAPGTVAERQLLMANLVEATRDSEEGFTASVDMLRRLDRVPAGEWSGTAEQAVALASAMRGRATHAAQALTYILDARASGRFANETLEDTLARFATLYATTGSVEMAIARLEQAASSSGGGIQDDKDGDLVIGGIRVPRGGKKPEPQKSFVMRAWEELRRQYSRWLP